MVKGTAIAHLNGLDGQLEEASRDGHHPGVLGVDAARNITRVAVEVLLVVNETLGKERHVARDEVV